MRYYIMKTKITFIYILLFFAAAALPGRAVGEQEKTSFALLEELAYRSKESKTGKRIITRA